MFVVFRILVLVGLIYLAYKLFLWVPQALSRTIVCSNCEGKGHWYGMRHREECKQCRGVGRIPK
jgi:hypothetical protein